MDILERSHMGVLRVKKPEKEKEKKKKGKMILVKA